MPVIPMRDDSTASERTRFAELGRSGLRHWGGILDEEFLRELQGERGIRIFREMSKNDPVVGASLFAYTTLAKEVAFRVDPAPGTSNRRKAEEVAQFVSSCLFEDMDLSWRDLLGEIFTFLTYGWSWFEVVYKRREGDVRDPTKKSRFTDNRIGWRKWGIRSQDSLFQWDLEDNGDLRGMIQRPAPTFETINVPLMRSLHFRTALEKNNPEGVSILRTAYTPWYYKRRIQIIRGIGIERDLAGLPMLTPPEGLDIWNPNDSAAILMKQEAEKLVRNIRRDEHEGVVKPFGWTLELLASSGSRQFDTTAVIAQLNAEIAMSMMTDFILVGHEQIGARSLSGDKRDTFAHAASSFLDNICDVINRFAIPDLVKLNGWPMELAPKLAHNPVAEISLGDLTAFIKETAGAGLIFPDENMEKHLRQRAQLPPPPEDREFPDPVEEMERQREREAKQDKLSERGAKLNETVTLAGLKPKPNEKNDTEDA